MNAIEWCSLRFKNPSKYVLWVKSDLFKSWWLYVGLKKTLVYWFFLKSFWKANGKTMSVLKIIEGLELGFTVVSQNAYTVQISKIHWVLIAYFGDVSHICAMNRLRSWLRIIYPLRYLHLHKGIVLEFKITILFNSFPKVLRYIYQSAAVMGSLGNVPILVFVNRYWIQQCNN